MAGRGRPKRPEGMATTLVAVRLDNALVESLKKSASDNRHDNLSREITSRLKGSFAAADRDQAVRAFGFLVAEVAQNAIPAGYPRGQWHSDPFLFQAFNVALSRVLNFFEPKGEIKRPEVVDILV